MAAVWTPTSQDAESTANTTLEPIILNEYQTLECRLTLPEAMAMSRIAIPDHWQRKRKMLSVSPGSASGIYEITAGSLVGTVNVGGRNVIVRPKVGSANTLFLASFSPERVGWWPSGGHYEEDLEFHDLLVTLFLGEVETLQARGLLEDYVQTEEVAPYLRGRILFADQIERQRGLPLPISISYEEFSADIVENRLLKSALNHVASIPNRHGSRCRSLLRGFEGVAHEYFDSEHPTNVVRSQRNAHYGVAVDLARVILRNRSIETAVSGIRSTGVLFNMDDVFEDFVFRFLENGLMLRGHRLIANAAGQRFRLCDKDRIPMEPDLSVWRSGICKFIGDIKYKDLDEKGVQNADVYQVVSYALAAGRKDAMLVYAASGNADDYLVPAADMAIRVRSVDITKRPHEILRDLDELADEVASLCECE